MQEAGEDAARSDERIRRSVLDADQRIDDLTRQVEFLTRAFEAFVELGDVRTELARFLPAAAARAAARTFIKSLVPSQDSVLLRDSGDVPGYWLPLAASGLALLLRADPGAEPQVAAACERDAERTALFLALGLRLGGAAQLAGPYLAAALPPPSADGVVTVAARHLWCALADGHYGPAARTALASWLEALVASISAADLRAAVEARRGQSPVEFGPFPRPTFGPRVPRSAAIEAALKSAAAAATSLVRLERWYGAEPDDPNAPAAAADVAACEPVINMLIDEGSPEEGPLLRRAAELEILTRTKIAPPAAPRWDDPAGYGPEVVVADLLAADPELAARRDLARAALCRPVAELAESLLADACPQPPAEMTVSLEDDTLTLAYDRSPDAEIDRICAEIERRAAEAGARGNRKYAADQLRRAVDRKAEHSTLIRSAGERLLDYRAQAAEIRAAAEASHQSLMHRMGQVAEWANPEA
ncbi:hypothetical protein [Actinospica robiniae]|uniref:hypothetical protein n=1 Tax=Actinospica robiniae TaxID=304901 RepID=UPI0012FC9BC3|nr:hypothetical protein [Actinospica robiniae]